jgi:hypothetical protein
MAEFNVGDKVQHRHRFLRAVGWYFEVPAWGIVVKVAQINGPAGRALLTVDWKGGDAPSKILCVNVKRWPG